MQLHWMPHPIESIFTGTLGAYQGYPFRARRSYGTGAEAHAVNAEIGDYDYHKSPVVPDLERLFGTNIRAKELKSIIGIVRLWYHHRLGADLPKPSRNTMRSFPLMVKYLETNYTKIAPILPLLTLCDEDKKPLHSCSDSD
jgi:hypothetical protein